MDELDIRSYQQIPEKNLMLSFYCLSYPSPRCFWCTRDSMDGQEALSFYLLFGLSHAKDFRELKQPKRRGKKRASASPIVPALFAWIAGTCQWVRAIECEPSLTVVSDGQWVQPCPTCELTASFGSWDLCQMKRAVSKPNVGNSSFLSLPRPTLWCPTLKRYVNRSYYVGHLKIARKES